MATKTINGIEYIVYEAGMIIDDSGKSYYFENNLDYDGDLKCLHFYATKDVVIRGYQDVRGYQYVGGNQYVGGYQYVGGNQYVKYIYLHLYCKYSFGIDMKSDKMKIGCKEKTISEWQNFFEQKETINMSSEDRNYKKLATAFEAAKLMRLHLIQMNDKPE